jgi:hypothetical protein
VRTVGTGDFLGGKGEHLDWGAVLVCLPVRPNLAFARGHRYIQDLLSLDLDPVLVAAKILCCIYFLMLEVGWQGVVWGSSGSCIQLGKEC